MRLIGLSGVAQAGKDTVAAILTEQHGFERRAFADKLRDALYALDPYLGCCDCGTRCPAGARYSQLIDELGYEEARRTKYGPEIRRLLQRLGAEVGRDTLGADVWVDAAFEVIRAARDLDIELRDYVFTDCRYPNEALRVRQLGGAVWRVERPGFGPVNGHESETALDDWPFDVIICNDRDLDTLERRVRWAVESLVATS